MHTRPDENAETSLAYWDYRHPGSIADVVAIVEEARALGARVRVRGAMHSVRGSILGEGERSSDPDHPVIPLMLDRLTGIRDLGGGRVAVDAGVSLGGDPYALGASNPQGKKDRSLFAWLNERGLALPITGGISHQTISGFVSTGSAGGSLQYSFHDAIESLVLVDGTATVRTLSRTEPEFWAALVSLGLFGVVCEVVIRPMPAYGIAGYRSVQRVADADVDLFSDSPAGGRISVADYLGTKEVSRLMWWPQRGVERVELWEARRVAVPDPGRIVPQSLGQPAPWAQIVARSLYALVFEGVAPDAGDGRPPSAWREAWQVVTAPPRFAWLSGKLAFDLFSPTSPTRLERADARELIEALFELGREPTAPRFPSESERVPRTLREELFDLVRDLRRIGADEAAIALAIRVFVQTHERTRRAWTDSDGFDRNYAADTFLDTWHEGLPMDNPVHDRLLPVQFTELWLPMSQASRALQELERRFARGHLASTGTFTIEVYAAKKTPAWLSAAHDLDVVRIDPFRYDDLDLQGRDRFFDQFFETLAPFDFRFHLGKTLSAPDSTTGVAYRERVLTKLADFRQLRRQFDPSGVFLTHYWAQHLGLFA